MLSAGEKAALIFNLGELIEADEPEAMLAILHRIAERMTMRAIRHDRPGDADRWMRLVNAVEGLTK